MVVYSGAKFSAIALVNNYAMETLGWVVGEPIDTNSGLNVDHGFNFSCESVVNVNVLWTFRFYSVKNCRKIIYPAKLIG